MTDLRIDGHNTILEVTLSRHLELDMIMDWLEPTSFHEDVSPQVIMMEPIKSCVVYILSSRMIVFCKDIADGREVVSSVISHINRGFLISANKVGTKDITFYEYIESKKISSELSLGDVHCVLDDSVLLPSMPSRVVHTREDLLFIMYDNGEIGIHSRTGRFRISVLQKLVSDFNKYGLIQEGSQ